MTKVDYSIILFSLLALCITYITWKAKSDNPSSFVIGNRSVGRYGAASSFVGILYNGPSLLYTFVWVAALGYGAIWIELAHVVCFLIVAACAARLHDRSRSKKYLTFIDMIEDRQGRRMARIQSLIALYGVLVLICGQLYAGGNIIAGIFGITPSLGIIINVAVVAAYVVVGGFINVIRTDILQAAVMLAIAIGALFLIDMPADSALNIRQFLAPEDSARNLIIGFSVMATSIVVNSTFWPVFYASRSARVLKQSAILASVAKLLLIPGTILFVAYVVSVSTSELTTDTAHVIYGSFFNNDAYPFLVAVFGLFIICSMFSSLDSGVFNSATIVLKNIILKNSSENDARFVTYLKITAFLILTLITLIALTIENFITWLTNAWSFVGIIVAYTYYATLFKRPDNSSDVILLTGLAISAICHITMAYLGIFANMAWVIVPFALPVLFVLLDYWMITRRTRVSERLIAPPHDT